MVPCRAPLKHTDLFRLEKTNEGIQRRKGGGRGRGSRDPGVSNCLMKDSPILNPQPYMRGPSSTAGRMVIIITATIIYPYGTSNGCYTQHHKENLLYSKSGFTWRTRKNFYAFSRAKFIHLPNLLDGRGKERGRGSCRTAQSCTESAIWGGIVESAAATVSSSSIWPTFQPTRSSGNHSTCNCL